MANSRQSATIFSPSSKRPTKRTRSSITEHSFQGIASSPRGGSVTYVSGTNCHPCVGSLIRISDLHYTKFRRAPGTKPRGLFSKLDSNYASPNDIQSRRFGCGRTPACQAGVLSFVPVAGLLNDESSCRTGALPQDSQR